VWCNISALFITLVYSKDASIGKIQYIRVAVFWFVTQCSDMVRYQSFGRPCCLNLQGEDGGSMALWNVSILTISQPRRLWLGIPLPWEPQILQHAAEMLILRLKFDDYIWYVFCMSSLIWGG